jgi:CRP-like cAMP-binding protein
MAQTECLIPTYGVLTEQQIALINENSHFIKHKKGETLFMQDRPVSHIIFIKKGLIKLFKRIDEKSEIILDILPSDQFIGLSSIFYENLYPYSASALQEGELIYVNSNVFRDILAENGEYSVQIMTLLSSKVVFFIDRMITLTKKQIPGRIAEMLLHFSKNIYKNKVITLPLSRQEIADLVQSSKETVSRTLTEFKSDRIIELDERKVTLKSLDLLEILNKIG